MAGRSLPVAADAGTAFDGKHLFQIARGRIQKIDPESGKVLSSIAAPGGASNASGLTWAEGTLWVGHYGERKIQQIDPESGRVLRTIESDRFVTGVTFLDDELWHGTDEDAMRELRHVDLDSGAVLERVRLPDGADFSGLEVMGGRRQRRADVLVRRRSQRENPLGKTSTLIYPARSRGATLAWAHVGKDAL